MWSHHQTHKHCPVKPAPPIPLSQNDVIVVNHGLETAKFNHQQKEWTKITSRQFQSSEQIFHTHSGRNACIDKKKQRIYCVTPNSKILSINLNNQQKIIQKPKLQIPKDKEMMIEQNSYLMLRNDVIHIFTFQLPHQLVYQPKIQIYYPSTNMLRGMW